MPNVVVSKKLLPLLVRIRNGVHEVILILAHVSHMLRGIIFVAAHRLHKEHLRMFSRARIVHVTFSFSHLTNLFHGVALAESFQNYRVHWILVAGSPIGDRRAHLRTTTDGSSAFKKVIFEEQCLRTVSTWLSKVPSFPPYFNGRVCKVIVLRIPALYLQGTPGNALLIEHWLAATNQITPLIVFLCLHIVNQAQVLIVPELFDSCLSLREQLVRVLLFWRQVHNLIFDKPNDTGFIVLGQLRVVR